MSLGQVHYVEVVNKQGERTRIRADEIGTVIERTVPGVGKLVTIPTKAKTIETMHTMEDLWVAINAALGGINSLLQKVPYADFPPREPADQPNDPKVTPITKPAAKKTA